MDAPSISAKDLPEWLLQRLPKLSSRYAEALTQRDGDLNTYGFIRLVVGSYAEQLLAEKNAAALAELFGLLAQSWSDGDDEIRNELKVVLLEDFSDCIQLLWPYFWQQLREDYFVGLTWYPSEATVNAHVNRKDYERRWKAEIDAVGGPPVSLGREMLIRWELAKEFQIKELRVLQPGSAAWLDAGLVWPVV